MLTRLKVSGFKNLVDVDLSFGPFTCIAGANGVGKSNLFDAIRFLSALADRSFLDAAKSVRDESGRTGDVRALFHRVGERVSDRMRFEAEMIVPKTGVDDLGQQATAKATFLRYGLELGFRRDEWDETSLTSGNLELLSEELDYIRPADFDQHLLFPHERVWRDSAVHYADRKSSFIATEGDGEDRRVLLKPDAVKGRPGRRGESKARLLPRTLLSSTSVQDGQTALLARREMQSWRLLQLEPTALRSPDTFTAPQRLGADGAHLPATLYRLARKQAKAGGGPVYEQVANRLQKLIREVRRIDIDRDDKSELLTLMATDQQGTPLPARALSDGTLRFLALTVLEIDPEGQGVICFEEPESGIHPRRIPAIMELLEDIAVDTTRPVGPDNPLQQVIVNTHSPGVVGEVDPDDLLYAETREHLTPGRGRTRAVSFGFPSDSWRADNWDGDAKPPIVSRGRIAAYLDPLAPAPAPNRRRMADHDGYSRHLFSAAEANG